MSIDLTGGYDEAFERVWATRPGNPEQREPVNAWIWDDHLASLPAEERERARKVPVIVAVVLHYGPGGWTAASRFEDILEESEIIVELMGGTDPARDHVLAAIQAGRHVVTANKQLIAQHGDELFAAAREKGRFS